MTPVILKLTNHREVNFRCFVTDQLEARCDRASKKSLIVELMSKPASKEQLESSGFPSSLNLISSHDRRARGVLSLVEIGGLQQVEQYGL